MSDELADRAGDVVWTYQRSDGRWEWRRVAANGQIVSTSGGQGYEDVGVCEQMAHDLNVGTEVRRWPSGESE